MASFQELEKGKYKLYVELGYRGKRRLRRTKTVYVRNQTEAKKELVLFEAELRSKQLIDDTKLSVEEFYPRWVDKYAKNHYGLRTFVETCNIIDKRIIPEFGPMKLKDVSKMDIIMFMDDLTKDGQRLDGKEGKLSSSSIHNVYKALNGLFKVAEDWELIERNPCYRVKLPKLTYTKGKVYGVEETKQLFKKMEDEEITWQIIVQVAAVTGARQGEIASLEAKHLNPDKNVLTIEQSLVAISGEGLQVKSTKSDRSRKVSIPKDLMQSLIKLKLIKQTQLMEVQNLREWKDHTFLFSNEFGKPLRPDSISQWWSRFLERNDKIKKIRFHDLRHTSATLLINQGVHAKVIQERLGHSNISTTMNTYGHVLEEADQSAASHFDAFYDSK